MKVEVEVRDLSLVDRLHLIAEAMAERARELDVTDEPLLKLAYDMAVGRLQK